MGSGTCEIVELEDGPKSSNFSKKNYQKTAIDKGKKPQGYTKSVEDDINKLFEAINVRTSFHGFTLDETGANTPRRNPSKKPMRMSTSSSTSAYLEPVSLKQALWRQCISQASEMAAMKRSLKPPGSPALSDAGKPHITTLYRSSMPPSPAFSDTRKPDITTMKRTSKPPEPPAPATATALSNSNKPPNVYTSVKASEESTSSSSRKMLPEQQDSKMKSKTNLSHSSLQSSTKKPTKKDETTLRVNEILREPESKTSKPINKATLKLRQKGKLKKLIMKKKSEKSHLVCQKCQCALTPNDPNGSNHGSTDPNRMWSKWAESLQPEFKTWR